MNLTQLIKSLFAINNLSKESLMVVLPIVGIVVVLTALSTLALVLKQFVYLSDEPKVIEHGSEPENEKKAVEEVVDTTEEDEKVAIATAIMLYMQDSTSRVNLTENLENVNNSWAAYHRGHQTTRAHRWQSHKAR